MKNAKIICILLAAILLLAGCTPTVTPTAEPTGEVTEVPTAEPTEAPTPAPTKEITEFVPAQSINEGRSEYDQFKTGTGMFVMPNVFGDNMLFQQNKPIRIWGYAPAGEHVEIRLLNQATGETVSQIGIIVADDATFLTELPAMTASYTEYELRVKYNKTSKVYKNILIGELYIAGGQSNMQVWMEETVGYADELKDAVNYPYLRYYNPPVMPMNGTAYPTDCLLSPQCTASNWGRADKRDFAGLSSIAYGFIKTLFQQLNVDGAEVPVGVLSLPIGGTRIVPWIPASEIENDKSYVSTISSQGVYKSYANLKAGSVTRAFTDSSALYNSKIAPVTNMNIRGLLWYQGCSDEGYGVDFYVKSMEKIINGWGKAFRFEDGTMPTIMSHLAPFQTGGNPTEVSAKVLFNTAFDKVAEKNRETRAVVAIYDVPLTYELGDKEPIHPKDKLPIGERFAYGFYGMLYNKTADWTLCPYVTNFAVMGGKVILNFTSVGEGLKSSDGLPLRGFAIAGEDKVYYEAVATITGKNTVTLSSPFVSEPKYATYAFTALNMKSNLVNSKGLAAVPYTSNSTHTTTLYAHHDYTSFDFLQAWRYFGSNNTFGYKYAQNVDMYIGNGCTFELDTTKSVAGNSLKVTGSQSAFSLNIALNYSGDIHQLKRYGTISICSTSPITAFKITNERNVEWTLDLLSSEPVAGTDFVRYTFSTKSGLKNGTHTDSISLTTMLKDMQIWFQDVTVVNIDSMVLGN